MDQVKGVAGATCTLARRYDPGVDEVKDRRTWPTAEQGEICE
jgi:hypothetical protein